MSVTLDLLGTSESSFQIGSGQSGTNSLLFRGQGTIDWNPTAARTIVLPDSSGTVILGENNLSDLTNYAAARANLSMGWRLLYQNHVLSRVTGVTTETNHTQSFTIPANTLGPNSTLVVYAAFTNNTTSNSKTHRCRVAGTSIFNVANTTQQGVTWLRMLHNRNSQSSQYTMQAASVLSFGQHNGASQAFSFDFSQAQTVTFTSQLATASDTADLNSVIIWAIE